MCRCRSTATGSRCGWGIGLRRAAELLFAKDGPDHPNAGIRVFRVIGAERRVGVEHNVEEKPRIEGSLPLVLASAFAVVEGLIRRPSRLRGIRFHEVPEYPEFSWKEAILNAAAHRDYSVEGRTTEVWFFEDRLEVTSPGGLIPDVTLAELLSLERRHMSRNPRIVRALVDLGIMRDQGEGIPRMFSEMAGLFLPAPMLEARPNAFALTLRNTPTLTEDDRAFVASLGMTDLTDVEFRALLEAHRRGRIDNARLRDLVGLDTLAASALLRRLRDRDLITLHAAGAASYYELTPGVRVNQHLPDVPSEPSVGNEAEVDPDRQGFGTYRQGFPIADRQGFETYRRGFDSDRQGFENELPNDLAESIQLLGPRPRQAALRDLIERLCAWKALRPVELAALLDFRPYNLTRRHLGPMVEAGRLERTHPENPAHPAQAYRVPTSGVDPLPRG